MKDEKTKKKGWFSVIRESMTKTGGCCGSGETCGGSAKKNSEGEIGQKEEKDKVEFDRGPKKEK